MAGPWTVTRERDDPGTDQRTAPSRLGSRSSRALFTRLPGVRPPRPITFPDRPTAVWPGSARRPGSLRKSRLKICWAATFLALMLGAAAVLVWATVSLAARGIASGEAAARRVAGPLVIPAPKSVAGLPRRFGAIDEPGAAPIVTEFRQRFGSVGSGLVFDTRAAADDGRVPGRTAKDITAAWTSGLYGQPGHLDPATTRPAWVMYIGMDATAKLGPPMVTVSRLMTGILGPYSNSAPWRVRAGHRGGAANCTVAWLAQTQVGVCGWASDHTIGAIASPIRATSVAELATLMVRMRYDLQQQ